MKWYPSFEGHKFFLIYESELIYELVENNRQKKKMHTSIICISVNMRHIYELSEDHRTYIKRVHICNIYREIKSVYKQT